MVQHSPVDFPPFKQARAACAVRFLDSSFYLIDKDSIMERHKPTRANMNDHQERKEPTAKPLASDLPKTEALFHLLSFPILDESEGIKIIGSAKKFGELLQLMHDTLLDDMSELEKAHDAHNWFKINQIAHKIEGGAIYLRAVRIKMACQYLAYGWKTGQHTLLERLYQQLMQVSRDSVCVFRDFFQKENHEYE